MAQTDSARRAVHDALVEVLRVGTQESDTTSMPGPPVVILKDVMEDFAAGAGSEPFMCLDELDPILMARLVGSTPDNYPLAPVPYLLSCFQRVSSQAVNDILSKGGQSSAEISSFQDRVEDQLVCMTFLTLCDEQIIPQPDEMQSKGALQLLDALWSVVPHSDDFSSSDTHDCGPVRLPVGFLSRSINTANAQGEFHTALTTILTELGRRARLCSILGDSNALVQAWVFLMESKPLVKAVVENQAFLPSGGEHMTGRKFQQESALASLVGISFLHDRAGMVEPRPSVRQQCYDPVDTKSDADMAQAFQPLLTASQGHQSALCALFGPKLLLSKDCRPHTLRWLSTALTADKERRKMQVNPQRATSDGFAFNLSRVMLHLCAPFLDFYSGKAQQFIDLRYLANGGTFRYSEDEERLAASTSDFAPWAQRAGPPAAADGASPFHFVCECFFMTAATLHVGAGQLIESMQTSQREYEHLLQQGPLARQDIVSHVKASYLGLRCSLEDREMMNLLQQWCQFTSAWLIFTATGSTPSQVSLPLPQEVPEAFQMIPEYIVEDLANFMMVVQQVTVSQDQMRTDDVVLACTALMGSPAHVKNPYRRFQLCTVLHQWIPNSRNSGRDSVEIEALFTMHPGVTSHLVPALLTLYKDVEYTERGDQFQSKFQFRKIIAELLEWLLTMPQHQATWAAVARGEQEKGLYLRFLNNLVNDSIYLLDEAIKMLPTIKEKEATAQAQSGDATQFVSRHQLMMELEHMGSLLKMYLRCSDRFVNMLVSTSDVAPQAMLVPEMITRIAQTLNYFLRHLTGPDRSKLSVNNPSKYDFDPKKLLGRILRIFVNLWSAPGGKNFAAAVAEDGRSYRPENFTEAADIAGKVELPGFDPSLVPTLEALAAGVIQASEDVQADDELIMEAPDEFLDPITSALMRDPVTMPASRQTIDRPTILRHLMTDPRDPISRAPLTPEELLEAPELKVKIDTWIAQKRAQRAAK